MPWTFSSPLMWAVTYSRHAKMPIINLRRISNVLRAHCERAMLLISSKSPFAKWSPLHSAWERDSARRETVACVSVHVRMMAKPYMHVVTTNLHPTRLNSSSIIHRVSLPRNESVRVFLIQCEIGEIIDSVSSHSTCADLCMPTLSADYITC